MKLPKMETLLNYVEGKNKSSQTMGGRVKKLTIDGYTAFNMTNSLIQKELWRRELIQKTPPVLLSSKGSEFLVEPPY